MIVVNSNPTSLIAQNNLTKSSNDLTQSINRLSSGYRINSSADDPAGLAVAAPLQAQVKGLYQANQNVLEATNITAVADNTLGVIQDNLTRVQQVATQAANGVYTKQQRQNLQQEIDQLTQEISRMVKDTNYNSFPLFSAPVEQFTFQIGPNGDANSGGGRGIGNRDGGGRTGGIGNRDGGGKAGNSQGLNAYNSDLSALTTLDITTQSKARTVLQNTAEDINTVTKSRAQIGAITNRLGYVQRTNEALSRAYQGSVSNIMDADYAMESSNYAAAQIRQQAGAAVLAQANAMPQIALTLLR